MEDFIKQVYGNKADWGELVSLSTEPIKLKTTGSALLPVIKAAVDKRRAKALVIGDVKELARLNKYYDTLNGNDYVVEEPVLKDGKYLFCYMNRAKGFIYPDAPVEPVEVSLRTIFDVTGLPIYRPKSLKEFETYASTGVNPSGFIDLIDIGHDVIMLMGDRGYSTGIVSAADKSGFPGLEILDWSMTGYNSPVETFWNHAAGALRIKSPFVTPNEIVIPIIPAYDLAWLITPKTPQVTDNFKVVPENNSIPLYGIPTAGRNPLLAVPMSGPVLITINDVPITKEQYDEINFSLFRFNLYDGRVTGTWLGDGKAQLAVELMETERYYGGYRGRLETGIFAMISTMINGKEYSQLIPMIDTIPDIPSQSYRAIMKSAVESTEYPGFLDVTIERQTLDPGKTRWELSNFDTVRKLVCYDAETLNNYQIMRDLGWGVIIKRVPNKAGVLRLLFNAYDPSFEGIEKYNVEITPIDGVVTP